MIAIADLTRLGELAGQEVGTSDWITVTQERINAFADATGDHQWIHVDRERAAAESPYGTTIAHGFLTLSLVSALMRNAISIGGLRMTINYGANRVRFVSRGPRGRANSRADRVAIADECRRRRAPGDLARHRGTRERREAVPGSRVARQVLPGWHPLRRGRFARPNSSTGRVSSPGFVSVCRRATYRDSMSLSPCRSSSSRGDIRTSPI